MQQIFGPVFTGGEISEAALKAAATMPMSWPGDGPEDGTPLLMQFVSETAKQSK